MGPDVEHRPYISGVAVGRGDLEASIADEHPAVLDASVKPSASPKPGKTRLVPRVLPSLLDLVEHPAIGKKFFCAFVQPPNCSSTVNRGRLVNCDFYLTATAWSRGR